MGGNDTFAKVLPILRPIHFYMKECSALYELMNEMFLRDEPIELLSLIERMRCKQIFSQDSVAYLTNVLANCLGSSNVLFYARKVKDDYVVREIIKTSNGLLDSAYNLKDKEVKDLLIEAEDAIFSLAGSAQKRGHCPDMSEMLNASFEYIQEVFENQGKLRGLSTGFTSLDDFLGGLRPGQMFVIGARPSMGKTTFAMNIAQHVAIDTKRPVLVFSMEMSTQQVMVRMLSSLSLVEHEKLDKSGKLTDPDYARITSTLGLLDGVKMSINDDGELTPSEIRGMAKRFSQKHKDIALVVVDYLGLMNIPEHKGNRVNEISEASKSLKAMAKELGCPVLVLSQLNRNLESRPNKRPQMSDLRDSGAVEQDADIIAFLYRDSVYNEDTQDRGIAEIIIAKNRSGKTGMIRLRYLSDICKFEDLTMEIGGNSYVYR